MRLSKLIKEMKNKEYILLILLRNYVFIKDDIYKGEMNRSGNHVIIEFDRSEFINKNSCYINDYIRGSKW